MLATNTFLPQGCLRNSAATLWVSALDAPNAFEGETLMSILDDLDELRSVIR